MSFARMRPFASIRFKILAAVCMLVVLPGLALRIVGKNLFDSYRALRIDQCRSLVEKETTALADIIQDLQANVLELAIMGEILPHLPPAGMGQLGKYAITQNFKINARARGGGIWYAPGHSVLGRSCFYAYREGESVLFDPDFAGAAYDYPSQAWYVAASEVLARGSRNRREVVWSAPYVDEAGSRALMTTVSAGIYDARDNFMGLATIDWSLEDIARHIAAIRPTENSAAFFADLAHAVLLGNGDPAAEGDFAGKPPQALPWFMENAPNERRFSHNNIEYISFAKNFDNGMAVIVNVPLQELFSAINRIRRLDIIILLCAMLAAAALTWQLLNRFISRPVARLCEAAARVGQGHLDVDFPASGGGELGLLADSLSAMTASLKKHIARIGAITAEKERAATELNIARDIQAAMLPDIFPRRRDLGLYAVMRPAREVGGDFYDFFFVDENRLAVVMADVSGKGVPAALFMAIAKTVIRGNARAFADPGAALAQANARLCENNKAAMFVTAFMGVLDLRNGIFSYANAGHNPFYIIENGRCGRVALKPALPLAVMENTQYAACSLELEPGANIFIYTDGVTEAANAAGRFWGAEGLEKALEACAALTPRDMRGLIDNVMDRLRDFTQNAPQSDDIAMLALAFRPAAQERVFPADAAALPDFMAFVETGLAGGGFTARRRMRFAVAAEEIFVNIASYAYGAKAGPACAIHAALSQTDSSLCLRISDGGEPFNPLDRQNPDVHMPGMERQPGGLGIFLAGQGADHLRYARKDGKNILTMFLYAEKPAMPDNAGAAAL